jgi:hypothetical protein
MKKELCYFCPDPREQDSMSLNFEGKYKRVYAVCVLETSHDKYPACKFHADYFVKRGNFGGIIPRNKEQAEKLLTNGGFTL